MPDHRRIAHALIAWGCVTGMMAAGLAPRTVMAQGARVTPGATDAPSATSTPASSNLGVSLPAVYQPQEGGSRFNSNEPRIVPDSSELFRLRYSAPQWLQQVLAFPPSNELLRYLGRDPAAARERAVASIRQVLSPTALPDGLQEHLIPLAKWAVLYEDWRKHGGIDVYLTKYETNGFTVLVMESHNHIIIAARELKGNRSKEFAGMLELAEHYADALLVESMKPSSPDSLKTFRTSLAPPFVYGYYTPKIDVLTGDSSAVDLVTTTGGQPNESSSSASATAVRFFCNGEFAAFMLLKPIKTGDLKNPFDPRFEPLNLGQAEQIPFWEDQSPAARPDLPDAEELRRRQVREYLGSFFYDQEGNALTDRIPVKDLEREFSDLSPEQKVDIARRKMVDEAYSTGMSAFASGETTPALQAWTRILQFDPENARAAILLNVAIKQRAKSVYGGNTESARRAEPAIQEALNAINRQQTLLSLRQQQEGIDVAKERAIQEYRTQAIDFFSEGAYTESLREWEKLLSIDPGNANALLFKEICETKIKQAARSQRSGAARSTIGSNVLRQPSQLAPGTQASGQANTPASAGQSSTAPASSASTPKRRGP